MSTVSRLNAALVNSKKPWSTVDPVTAATFTTVGTIECYVCEQEFSFKRTWSKNYPVQAMCLGWEESSYVLSVGTDDGTVELIRSSPQKKYISMESVAISKIHAAKVTGLRTDTSKKCVYSAAEDGEFRISDDEHLARVWSFTGKAPLTGLEYDPVDKRIFLTSAKGEVFIWDVNDKKAAKLLISLEAQSKGCIRGLAVDTQRFYAFTGGYDDGQISTFFFDKPGREKYASRYATFKGKDKVRAVAWSASRSQIYSGSANGTITFWNPKKNETLYVQKCHDSQITQVSFLQQQNLLVTSSKSKEIKFWRLPKEWRNKEIQNEEDTNMENQRKAQNVNYVKDIVKRKEEDSDDDDLAGWHKD